tara:strand:- start:264 stop:455 length:192 start_codon:yes stop_codon:yes gene_type:complete
MKTTFPMINAVCAEFESLRSDGVYEDIAISICSTHFATAHDITMRKAEGIVSMALHMNGLIEL